jgi:uncharacterized protein (TIGR00255 family)
MLRSMTGYGESTVETSSFSLAVEVKTVNNRFLKITTKIAEEVSFVQNAIEECVRKALPRGSVSITLRFNPRSCSDLYEIDVDVLKKYLKTLEKLGNEIGSPAEIQLKDVLPLPGVVRTQESLSPEKEEVLPVAQKAVREALDRVLRMRIDEGAYLEQEFRRRAALLSDLLCRVKEAAPRAVQEQSRKLEDRVNLLLGQKGVALAAEEILKEVALLAERSDIAEEIARFDSHLIQFVDALGQEQSVGRKLEFLAQEMLREANTMSAKSASAALNQVIVEIKAEVDRLREQAMNVE